MKLTLPVGLDPATVAVKVTLLPTGEDGIERARQRGCAGCFVSTTCDSVALAEAALLASPP